MENDSDWLSRNSTFFLSALGIVSGLCGGILSCLLKSRCTTISCFGVRCERDVLPPSVVDIEMERSRRPVEVLARPSSIAQK